MTTQTLIRTSGVLAVAGGMLIAIDKILPDSFVVSTLGLCAALFGLWLLTAIFLLQRSEAGLLGDIGYALNSAGLALMVGVSFVFNYAFPHMDEVARSATFSGTSGAMLQGSYVVYTVGVIVFGAAIIKARRFPAGAAILYIVGFAGGFVRFVLSLPQIVDTVASVVAAAGIIWLGAALWSQGSRARAAQT